MNESKYTVAKKGVRLAMVTNINHLRVVLAAAAVGVLAALAMLVLAATYPAEAAFPGQNGKIAFQSGEVLILPNGELDLRNLGISTMNANGQGLDRLTNDTHIDREPAWSPDGTKIAFASSRDDLQGEIYTMNTNGQGLDRLTTNTQADSNPDWQTLSPPDTTAPTVTSTVPTARAEGVATTVDITATFSEDMMASTINESTFMLFKKGSTTKIAAALTYDAATKMATLNPTNSLQAGVTYKAVVTTGAKDEAGNPLDQNTTNTGLQQKRWVFFTV